MLFFFVFALLGSFTCTIPADVFRLCGPGPPEKTSRRVPTMWLRRGQTRVARSTKKTEEQYNFTQENR